MEYVKYDGIIYDTVGKPAPNIVVILKVCPMGTSGDNAAECVCNFFEDGRATTDASGQFHIKDKAARTNKYTVKLEKYGLLEDNICTSESGLSDYSTLYLVK